MAIQEGAAEELIEIEVGSEGFKIKADDPTVVEFVVVVVLAVVALGVIGLLWKRRYDN